MAFKIIIRSIKSLSFRNLLKLARTVIPHPIFVVLTVHATVKSFNISRKHFPKSHSSDGKGNAFRHALWCCLIMMYCCKVSSAEKSLIWCKKITDLHEDLFPNPPLQRFMDLHNNQVGMDYFMELLPTIHRQFFETSFFIKHLIELTENAVPILEIDKDSYSGKLVYLLEEGMILD